MPSMPTRCSAGTGADRWHSPTMLLCWCHQSQPAQQGPCFTYQRSASSWASGMAASVLDADAVGGFDGAAERDMKVVVLVLEVLLESDICKCADLLVRQRRRAAREHSRIHRVQTLPALGL